MLLVNVAEQVLGSAVLADHGKAIMQVSRITLRPVRILLVRRNRLNLNRSIVKTVLTLILNDHRPLVWQSPITR